MSDKSTSFALVVQQIEDDLEHCFFPIIRFTENVQHVFSRNMIGKIVYMEKCNDKYIICVYTKDFSDHNVMVRTPDVEYSPVQIALIDWKVELALREDRPIPFVFIKYTDAHDFLNTLQTCK